MPYEPAIAEPTLPESGVPVPATTPETGVAVVSAPTMSFDVTTLPVAGATVSSVSEFESLPADGASSTRTKASVAGAVSPSESVRTSAIVSLTAPPE